MTSHDTEPKKIWFDTNIGSDPSSATALLFALKHPKIEVVGISISGKNQLARKQEALALLKYANAEDIPVLLGNEVARINVDAFQPDVTISTGPLTNIAKLALDETSLGELYVMGGAFRTVYYRGTSLTLEPNIVSDLDSARVALSQYHPITMISFEASSQMLLGQQWKEKIEESNPFLAARYKGYEKHLEEKFGEGFSGIVVGDILPICAILEVPTITTEIIEFIFQADGSFRSTTPLDACPEPITEILSNPDSVPMPKMKHKVIRTVNSSRILEELTSVL